VARPASNFETAPLGEATPDHVVVWALHAGSFPGRFFQQAQRVAGLACINCRQPRLSPKSDTDLARSIPPANDQPCVIATLPKWPRPSKWR
jgi:hypothetical protein